MREEIADSGRVIITRNDLQVRIKKPFDLNLDIGRNEQPTLKSVTSNPTLVTLK